ncbi:class I SAM-dependent methyltransferase [Paractinoplanes rishiriensis]|nr:methyltransferase domain-containing protein [Actinoplanes rishiriensis]
MTTMVALKRRARRVVNRLLRRRGGAPQVVAKTTESRDKWATEAQEGEFLFHKNNKWRQTPDFMRQTDRLLRHFGFTPEQYAGRTVVDVGAGSMLRTKFFTGAHLVVVEPLADRFLTEIENTDLKDAAELYSTPAEQLITELVGRCDLVISINVLDHCYDFPQIVDNIRQYLKPDGLAFLTFDMHDKADHMHPLSLTEQTCKPIFAKAKLRIEKVTTGVGDALGGAQTYGHGPFTLNYWLRRADI